jgi:hypothetical protein
LHDLRELPVLEDRLDRRIKSQEILEDTPFFAGRHEPLATWHDAVEDLTSSISWQIVNAPVERTRGLMRRKPHREILGDAMRSIANCTFAIR